MYVCKVMKKLVSTHKNDNRTGCAIVMVQQLKAGKNGAEVLDDRLYAAVDPLGCAEGNVVLITTGSNSSKACKHDRVPVDMTVVGILD